MPAVRARDEEEVSVAGARMRVRMSVGIMATFCVTCEVCRRQFYGTTSEDARMQLDLHFCFKHGAMPETAAEPEMKRAFWKDFRRTDDAGFEKMLTLKDKLFLEDMGIRL